MPHPQKQSRLGQIRTEVQLDTGLLSLLWKSLKKVRFVFALFPCPVFCARSPQLCRLGVAGRFLRPLPWSFHLIVSSSGAALSSSGAPCSTTSMSSFSLREASCLGFWFCSFLLGPNLLLFWLWFVLSVQCAVRLLPEQKHDEAISLALKSFTYKDAFRRSTGCV